MKTFAIVFPKIEIYSLKLFFLGKISFRKPKKALDLVCYFHLKRGRRGRNIDTII